MRLNESQNMRKNMKKVLKFIKKIVLSFLLLFCYNLFLSSLELSIPINFITLGIVFIFDFPGIIGLFIFQLISL